eukprot:gene7665-biopygen13610
MGEPSEFIPSLRATFTRALFWRPTRGGSRPFRPPPPGAKLLLTMQATGFGRSPGGFIDRLAKGSVPTAHPPPTPRSLQSARPLTMSGDDVATFEAYFRSSGLSLRQCRQLLEPFGACAANLPADGAAAPACGRRRRTSISLCEECGYAKPPDSGSGRGPAAAAAPHIWCLRLAERRDVAAGEMIQWVWKAASPPPQSSQWLVYLRPCYAHGIHWRLVSKRTPYNTLHDASGETALPRVLPASVSLISIVRPASGPRLVRVRCCSSNNHLREGARELRARVRARGRRGGGWAAATPRKTPDCQALLWDHPKAAEIRGDRIKHGGILREGSKVLEGGGASTSGVVDLAERGTCKEYMPLFESLPSMPSSSGPAVPTRVGPRMFGSHRIAPCKPRQPRSSK